MIKRRYKLSCDPVSSLYDVEDHDGSKPIVIGHVKLKCDVCLLQANVYTPEMSQAKFIIWCSCLKPQWCFPCHCKPMDTLTFDIYDSWVGTITGTATKVFSDYLTEYCSKGWHWVIDFPFESSHKSKALIIEAIHLIDMAYFDQWRRKVICCL